MNYSNGMPAGGSPDDAQAVLGLAADEMATAAPESSDAVEQVPTDPIAAGPAREPADDRAPEALTFHDALARAMQAAADRELERLNDSVTAAAAASVERAHERATTEAEDLRRSAEADIDAMQARLKAQIEQLRREAVRRTEGRRTRLEDHLKQHGAIIDVEIASVDEAVRAYRATLDGFFKKLHETSDPAEIVQQAGMLPAAPDLDATRASARAAALANHGEDRGDGIDGAEGPEDAAGDDDAGDADGTAGKTNGADRRRGSRVTALRDVADARSTRSHAVEDEEPDQGGAASRLIRSILDRTAVM